MSTTTCSRFAQNAWKKDLCSNCFKSKEEHKAAQKDVRPIRLPVQSALATPPKSIIRTIKDKKQKKHKVTFPKEVSQVIGYGGDWSDMDSDSDTDTIEATYSTSRKASAEEITKEIDELEQELDKLTKVNTSFNMSNGNLLGDPEANIRRSFASMQLGAKDANEAKKQKLKITVMPFGGPVTTNKVNDIKQRFSAVDEVSPPKPPVILKTIIKSGGVEYVEEQTKAPTEKSLLDEISETLTERKNKEQLEQQQKAKFDTQSKRSITRHSPIVKDLAKPKISVFHKSSDSDSNISDTENGSSGYYDVVEASSRYENLVDSFPMNGDQQVEIRNKHIESSFFSNHLISEMFSTNKDRKNNRNYNFMSEITSDGLIVTKASSSDDAMDSNGSSFDYATSSDEEMSSINRSESDSGIGICLTTPPSETTGQGHEYEDVQVQEKSETKMFSKSRELAGEPDGSADPDGSGSEAPALPSSPPPNTSEPRLSFLHSPKATKLEKPAVPVKPTVSIIQAFAKRSPNQAEMISELQSKIKGVADKPTVTTKQESTSDVTKGVLKKSRAPDPPSPTTEDLPSPHYENVTSPTKQDSIVSNIQMFEINLNPSTDSQPNSPKAKTDDQYSFLYTRNPTGSVSKSTSPVIREKDKRERATINPKFRSLNTFSSQYKSQVADKVRSTTPEPAPRKSLSMSTDNLAGDDKKKKPKFSIKKFLRINSSSKTTDAVFDKKDGVYGKRSSIANDDEIDGMPLVKPRLVIIHPIDINNMEVEVVKEMGKINEIVTGKPPAPPLRKGLDTVSSKPNRPPPPKSAEVRRKLKLGIATDSHSPGGTLKLAKEDSVYANLGEIRSAIAPRKPERTASMREREAQLELAKKRLSKFEDNETDDAYYAAELLLSPSSSNQSTLDRIELRTTSTMESSKSSSTNKSSVLGDGIKSSIQKMNNTIDSYLKDKLTDSPPVTTITLVKPQPPATPMRSISSLGSSGNLTLPSPTTNSSKMLRNSEVELRGTYEPIVVQSQRSSLPDNTAGGYQLIGSALASARPAGGYCKSEIVGNAVGRFQSQSMANLARAPSRSYCGSEIGDLDIYSPYSFYGGSELGAGDAVGSCDDGNWGGVHQNKQRPTNRLRLRKGRSVVHKTLEDNYGAVVVANHEALAQVLDQLQKTTTIPTTLRPLAASINLRFDDFTILEGVRGVVAGRRAFHPAVWANQTHVTLALSVDCQQMADLSAITEFCDLVPSHYLPLMPTTEQRMVQATISVLPRMFVDTLQSFGQMLRIRSENLQKHHSFGGSTMNLTVEQPLSPLRCGQSVQNLSTFQEDVDSEQEASNSSGVPHQIPGMPSFDDLMCREVGFVLLQLVNGLKLLQSKGIEELPLSLSNVILCRNLDNKEAQAKLCVLHGLNQDASREDDEPTGTLCQCAHSAVTQLLPSTKLTATLTKILVRDRSESLTRTKSVLEFALWGPVDVALNGNGRERELALQRWLDLERATVLHGLIQSRVELSVYDECHLMFLVRSSAKTMSEASSILSGIADSDN